MTIFHHPWVFPHSVPIIIQLILNTIFISRKPLHWGGFSNVCSMNSSITSCHRCNSPLYKPLVPPDFHLPSKPDVVLPPIAHTSRWLFEQACIKCSFVFVINAINEPKLSIPANRRLYWLGGRIVCVRRALTGFLVDPCIASSLHEFLFCALICPFEKPEFLRPAFWDFSFWFEFCGVVGEPRLFFRCNPFCADLAIFLLKGPV